jgi:hypothetical protein
MEGEHGRNISLSGKPTLSLSLRRRKKSQEALSLSLSLSGEERRREKGGLACGREDLYV